MKGATSICTIIIVTLLLLTSAKATAQPASTNQPSSLVTLTRIPPLQMVNSVLFSPDGKSIATLRGEDTSWNSGGKPLRLEIWSAPKGNLLWTAKERAFSLLAYSPDSTRLAGIAEESGPVLWDAANGKVKARFRPKTVPFSIAAFLPDGRTLVTVASWPTTTSLPDAGEIQLWKAKTGHFTISAVRRRHARTSSHSSVWGWCSPLRSTAPPRDLVPARVLLGSHSPKARHRQRLLSCGEIYSHSSNRFGGNSLATQIWCSQPLTSSAFHPQEAKTYSRRPRPQTLMERLRACCPLPKSHSFAYASKTPRARMSSPHLG